MDYQLQQTGPEVQKILDQAPGEIDGSALDTLSSTGVFFVKNEGGGVMGILLCYQNEDAFVQCYIHEGFLDVRLGSSLPITSDWANLTQMQINQLQEGKVSKREGYGLSQNDFTDYYKGTIASLMRDVANLTKGKQDTISDIDAIRSGAAAGSTAYQKPLTGIPESDLADAVQTLLENAGTAIQPAALTPIQNAINTIEAVIPSAASAQNQLADKNYVDSKVSSSTANFVGTYESLAELQAVQNPTNNDYGFVIEKDALGNEYYDRYKFNGTEWMFEYKVESTSFTADQWAAIQSGITSALVTKLNALPTEQQINTQLAGKQEKITTVNVNVDNSTGTPSGSASVNGSTLTINLSNLKGATNAPDEEDLTSEKQGDTDILKFKDKAYNSALYSGLGRVYLRKNIVTLEGTGKNVLTQAMVNTANTIYHIQYDYDLNGQTIALPAGCVLEFDGGSIKDSAGTGKIVLNDTFIKCDAPRIGILNCSIEGTYTNPTAYPEWLAKASTDDFAPAIQKLIDCSANGTEIKFTASNYKVIPVVTLRSNIAFTSDSGSRIYTDETALYTAMFRNGSGNHCENLLFSGLTFEQIATNYTELDGTKVNRMIIGSYDTNNIRITGCKFIFNGTNCVSVNGSNCINTYILNNEFIFKRATNPSSYDVSAIYVTDHYHVIENNRIYGYTNTTADRVNGGIESHGVCGIVANNTINSAKVCINVVNNITASNTDAVGRMITGNICNDVNNFLILWPMQAYGTMKNIVISNNIATGIKEGAVSSTYASAVKGAIENLFIRDNVFEGLSNNFDGNEFSSTIDDVYNLVAIKLYTPNDVLCCRIERNVFRKFPCSIIRVGHYNASADASTKQNVEFVDNILLGCFNGTISQYYNAYGYFALFGCRQYVNLKIDKNVIEIPSTTTMPPILCACGDADGRIELNNTKFTDIVTKMVYIHSGSTFVSDLLSERTEPSVFLEGTDIRFVEGDYLWLRNRSSVCTKAGRNVSIAMDNANVNLLYGVTYYTCDNMASLVLGDLFASNAFGTSSILSDEKIACICNGKIYTNRWRTSKSYFEEGVTQYNVTLTYQQATFGSLSININASGPSSFDKGMMYYSLGGNRPLFKNNSGDWVDVFNHVYAGYQGSYANRPNSASFGHFYVTTDSGNRRLIIKNSTGADSWIDTDGFDAKYARKGTTAGRPTPANVNQDKGLSYFDTTLNKPIYWTGTGWVDATGAAV